jgi:hypothetical protein
MALAQHELSLPKTEPPLFSGSCGLPFEGVVQSSCVRSRSDFAPFRWLHFPSIRRVHIQALVDAVFVVVLEVFFQDPFEMGFAEDDYCTNLCTPPKTDRDLPIAQVPDVLMVAGAGFEPATFGL